MIDNLLASLIEVNIRYLFGNRVSKFFLILGTLKNWWSNSTGEEYEKRAQCIIDQYGNFTAEQVGLNLNGINTQGENIADNGGIKESYGGYGMKN